MKLYTSIGFQVGSVEAAELSERLVAWHDAMVAHERRLLADVASTNCDETCPHNEALVLWREALAVFEERANDLSFLRSRATTSADNGRTQGD